MKAEKQKTASSPTGGRSGILLGPLSWTLCPHNQHMSLPEQTDCTQTTLVLQKNHNTKHKKTLRYVTGPTVLVAVIWDNMWLISEDVCGANGVEDPVLEQISASTEKTWWQVRHKNNPQCSHTCMYNTWDPSAKQWFSLIAPSEPQCRCLGCSACISFKPLITIGFHLLATVDSKATFFWCSHVFFPREHESPIFNHQSNSVHSEYLTDATN